MTLKILFGYIIFIMLLVTAINMYIHNVPVSEGKKKMIIKNAMFILFVLIIVPIIFKVIGMEVL
ncbi:hypothetical protein [Psychrobacillus sp. FSL K6-1464]|uniref:hypothetical protein n=1 Tax=Psychrobacillus sp. FSL K6-1464 TaxID=2921545 RepID=UPI0030F8265F